MIGIHAHFDENNALPAFDNFNPSSPGDLFSSNEFDRSRSIVYSMGCHAGYSLSDIQVGAYSPDDPRSSSSSPTGRNARSVNSAMSSPATPASATATR